MNIITAVDKNWAIGRENDLLVKLKEDMKFFKNATYGKCVIMGKNTYESLGSKPLPGRYNIVLSDTPIEAKADMKVFSDIKSILDHVDIFFKSHDVFVIGGASIYKQFLPFCDTCFITKIDEEFEADTYFPENLDKYTEANSDWVMTYSSEEISQAFTEEDWNKLKFKIKPSFAFGEIEKPKKQLITFKFCRYQRIQ